MGSRSSDALLEQASEVYAVLDHTKLGRSAFTTVCPLSELTGLITDDGASPASGSDYAERDLHVFTGTRHRRRIMTMPNAVPGNSASSSLGWPRSSAGRRPTPPAWPGRGARSRASRGTRATPGGTGPTWGRGCSATRPAGSSATTRSATSTFGPSCQRWTWGTSRSCRRTPSGPCSSSPSTSARSGNRARCRCPSAVTTHGHRRGPGRRADHRADGLPVHRRAPGHRAELGRGDLLERLPEHARR